MAVESILKRKTGSMRFKIGVDGKGNDVFRTVTLSNLQNDATDENILNVLKGINALMDPYYSVSEMNKDEKYLITQSVE